MCVDDGGSHGGLHQSVYGRSPRNLEWADQGPRDGYASIAFPQRLGRFFSPAAKGRHSSRDKKAVCRRPPRCFGPDGCGPIAPRAKDRHRGCDGRGPTTEEDHHGYHRHLHRGGQRLRRIGQDAHAQLQGKVRPDRKRTTTRRPTIGSSQVPSNAAPPGRRPRGTAIANISRSRSTIRVFRRRSTPRW